MQHIGFKFLSFIGALLLLAGCSYNDFCDIEPSVKPWEVTTTFAALPLDSPIAAGVVASGVVVSCDSCGSFYREIVVQDFANSAAIAIQLNFFDSYALWNISDIVAVDFGGLTISRVGGRLVTSPVIASPAMAAAYIHYQNANLWPTPAVKTIEQLSAADIGLLVRINGIYFENRGFRFGGEVILKQYENDEAIILYTSPYASFARQIVPEGLGDIEAIVVTNKDGKLQLQISSLSNLFF